MFLSSQANSHKAQDQKSAWLKKKVEYKASRFTPTTSMREDKWIKVGRSPSQNNLDSCLMDLAK